MGIRLMIVDDNAEVRRLIRRLCESAASAILECADGAEAVAACAAFLPDWIVMDVAMPKMDGLEATRLILKTHPAVKIVVLSQFNTSEFRLSALAAGARVFLTKENMLDLPSHLR